jgi:hypothetical protein
MSTDPSGTRNPRSRSSRRGRKVRKVHRVVRHLDVWSVAKLAAVFVACAYVVSLVSGYLLWQAAERVGTIEGVEGFFEDAGGYDSFLIDGGVVFRTAVIVGLLLAALTVALSVVSAVLFNLISDLTGGVRMTVIDEDLIVAPARRRPAGDADRPAAREPNGSEAERRGPPRTAPLAEPGERRPADR